MRQYEPGERIGGEYIVLDVFGGEQKSGMGVVYLVEEREYPKPFVLKTSQPSMQSDIARQRFLSEARTWIDAGAHANIVQAHWVKEIAGNLFIAAEYIPPDEEGRNTLTHHLRNGAPRLEVALRWASQFCYGMDYARSRGIVAHRDIKPDNLMIDGTSTLKVTDFGIAKSGDVADGDPSRLRWWKFKRNSAPNLASYTATGTAMGTLPYMAPELFTDAKKANHQSDIYSFGVVLYQMATGGDYPYPLANDGDMASEFFIAHNEREPIPVASPLMPIILKCLAKFPGDRYLDYDQLLGSIADTAEGLHIRLPAFVHVDRDDEELYAKAQSYLYLGDSDQALQAIEEYVSKYEENECGWTEKGKIHLERGELEEGIAATRRSLALNPYNTHAWNNLGIALNRVDAPLAETRDAYTNALLFDPHNTAAMMNFAGSLVRTKQYSEAADYAARALRLRPDKPLTIENAERLLSVLFEEKKLDAAEHLLDSWTQASPVDVKAWHNLGLIHMDRGNPQSAAECFAHVHELDSADDFAVKQLARLNFELKRPRECIEYCNEMLRRRYEPSLAICMKARVLNFIGGYQRALSFVQSYLQRDSENADLWQLVAEIHEYRDNFDEALLALDNAERIFARSNRPGQDESITFVKDWQQRLRRAMEESL